MASLDTESDTVVVRIVYDGPPTAGKTTSLQALAARFGQGNLYTPEASAGGRTLFFDWLEYTGGRFDGRPIRCQLVSVPGQQEFSPRREQLLTTADAVVFVGDTSRSGLADSRAHLDDLLTRLRTIDGPPVGVVFQANKRDLPDAAPLEALRGELGLAVIESVASRGEGIRESFVFAVRLALDRVRELHRLGQLTSTQRNASEADQLLASLRSLPLSDTGATRELWPERLAPVNVPLADGLRAPDVPDASIPSGWVWPPINGRILLQEATASGVQSAQELAPREFIADTATGWRFHSGPGARFDKLEDARAALIHWAQVHASLSQWTSAHRCVALCETGDGGFRLWQIVRSETTVWKRLAEALSSRELPDISARLKEATALCTRVAENWSSAPWELPCTLETVSALDGTFVSLVPEATHVRPVEPIDRRAKLWHQLETLVRGELGAEASALFS